MGNYLDDNARTVFLIHGWSENHTADWFEDLKNAFLSRTDITYNVIQVDYNKVASELYPVAVKKSVGVGNLNTYINHYSAKLFRK